MSYFLDEMRGTASENQKATLNWVVWSSSSPTMKSLGSAGLLIRRSSAIAAAAGFNSLQCFLQRRPCGALMGDRSPVAGRAVCSMVWSEQHFTGVAVRKVTAIVSNWQPKINAMLTQVLGL